MQKHDNCNDGSTFGCEWKEPLVPKHRIRRVVIAHEYTCHDETAKQHLSPVAKHREHHEIDHQIAPKHLGTHALTQRLVPAMTIYCSRRKIGRFA